MQNDVKITYLEMTAPPSASGNPLPEGLTVEHWQRPGTQEYLALYNAVGARWSWTDRNKMPEDELTAYLQDCRIAVYRLLCGGNIAGYVELDARDPENVEIKYFGLVPAFIGQGLGGAFLDWAVRRAWSMAPRRVHVNTCTLDHGAALNLYRRAGFRVTHVADRT